MILSGKGVVMLCQSSLYRLLVVNDGAIFFNEALERLRLVLYLCYPIGRLEEFPQLVLIYQLVELLCYLLPSVWYFGVPQQDC